MEISSSKLADSIKIGPWGGPGGNQHWSFKAKVAITEIIITHAIVVDSISFTSIDENGKIEHSEKYGGGGGKTEKVLLDWPGEYLTSISGTCNIFYGNYVVQSLCFYTNQTRYGPFGCTSGSPFNFPMEDGVIIGFHGRGWPSFGYVDAIGVYVKPVDDLFCGSTQGVLSITNKESSSKLADSIKIGPWGGPGGNQHWSFKAKVAITEIIITHGMVVDSVSFTSIDENGKIEHSEKFGGSGGKTEKVLLDWPGEYLTSISGTCNIFYGNYVVQSLCFYTNQTRYGPFGCTSGSPFNFPMEDGVIIGFHGRGWPSFGYVDAIGVYVKPFEDLFCGSTQGVLSITNKDPSYNWKNPTKKDLWGGNGGKEWNYQPNGAITEIKVHHGKCIDSISFKSKDGDGNWRKYGGTGGKEEPPENSSNLASNSIKVGPWGGPGGDQHWSFKAKVAITEIIICNGWVVDSVSFVGIDENGEIHYSKKYGSDRGEAHKISLDWPREFLTSLSGTCHDHEGNYGIQSLCFHTNRTKYGPYGRTDGSPFNFPMEDGVIIGFYGRAGCSYASFVNAIGVYAKPFEDSFCDSTQGLFITHKVNDVMNTEVPREAGPWGGITGKQFDDGVFSSIGQVNIFVGDGVVRGIIGFLYNTKDGKSVESKRHGGGGRDDEKIYRIKLDCSKEYIVGITGYFGPVVENAGHEALRSITFYSNKGKYGPFGNEIGTAFSSSISDGKVVGFHGRSGCYLCALGVHMEYFDSN
ncbi:hypothetical protein EZV62_021392 [Acer yangbiense]|uniref:Jacalin-type lectin domain-containing protein n=1 Tax=Acer yangbiense TaxID=1000413 RepID=A0A5C7H5A1_9ROSI|nr:hypothetical protein EZV62_021392 [Acer yangbiense]